MSRIKYLLIAALVLPTVLFSQNEFKPSWSHAYKLESADKNFKLKFGGRIHYDMAWMNQDDALANEFGDFTNGTELRRVRFYNSGTVYSNISYKLQLEFAGGEIGFKDVYIDFHKLPVLGNLRVGQMKEPYRLEVLVSSNDMTFIERTPYTSFAPERNAGILVHNQVLNGALGYQAGVFRNADGTGNDKNAGDAYNFTARVSTEFLKNEERNSMVHLAVGFSNRNNNANEYKVSGRPAVHLAPKYLSTGTLTNVDNVELVNLEGAYYAGPLSIQAEYLMAKVNGGTELNFSSYYGQVSYFLTGESRPWKGSYEGFGGIKPKKNFGENGGGAWEIGLRFSSTDLNDRIILGGKMTEWTAGVNWYLNPASRIQLNYVLADVDGLGKASAVVTRFHIAF
ncbi:MAG: hypothetical protein D6816_15310 [Bacteroidetes bacterium]|nr:MAG: hypothetical protein D6816_15310 [Bacteroidota bacterium]